MEEKVYLSLGSNLGDRQAYIEAALEALSRNSIRTLARSSFYQTEPQDVADQPWFLNLAVECATDLEPFAALAHIQTIEREAGRTRVGLPPRGPRTIDIDILLFGRLVMKTEWLTIPHERMLSRRFVLEPLLEIAPALSDPRTGKRLKEFLPLVSGQAVQRL